MSDVSTISRGHIALGLTLLMWLAGSIVLAAERCAVDDMARRVCLPVAASRIAALSPGATELTYAAGAGEKVVAVVAHSDFPAAAKQVQSVGSLSRLDLEALLALRPDLLIGWTTGNPREQTDRLADLGMTVFFIEPRNFEGVASAIERLAYLAGTESVGDAVAEHFRSGIAKLNARYRELDPVRVFYQVWDEPVMTVNDEHLIGKVLTLCGGVNVFGKVDSLVPRIDVEAVLASNPEAIIAGGMGEANAQWLAPWSAFDTLEAVKQDNLFFVPPSLIQRPTPRLLEGSRLVCEKLEQARARR